MRVLESLGSWALPLSMFAMLVGAPGAEAQLIPIKTVPVATGNQFAIFPARNIGMAGVSIALDDPLLDPWINPAAGARVDADHIFTAPAIYSIGEDGGSARTLPAGLAFRPRGTLFGGIVIAMQQLITADAADCCITVLDEEIRRLGTGSALNKYAAGYLGGIMNEGATAIGFGGFVADLGAVQGTRMLYPGSEGVRQSGTMVDLRVGLTHEWDGDREIEAVLVHNRISMIHRVDYADFQCTRLPCPDQIPAVRTETNPDRTRTWGGHVGYAQPLADTGLRIGGIFTINRKSHPRIPNYDLMRIPRDPGYSWAYNFGIGLSSGPGAATAGVDLIYQPILSHTWAEAVDTVMTASGNRLAPGDRTVENDFRFSNWLLRVGVGRQDDRFGFQLGLELYAIDYRLEQVDHVAEDAREQRESWVEWSPTWGLSVEFPEFRLRYTGALTMGTGQPGIFTGGFVILGASARSADVLLAPRGPLTLREARVFTNRLTISMPLGGG